MPDQPPGLNPDERLLWRVCASLLPRFMLEDAGILAQRMVQEGGVLRLSPDPNARYTAEAVKALYRLRQLGLPCPIEPDHLLHRLVTAYLGEMDFGDVALVLWADALGEGRYHARLWDTLLSRLPRGPTETLYAAWTLSAVCHCPPWTADPPAVARLAHHLAKSIGGVQHRSGLFYGARHRLAWMRGGTETATLPVHAYAIEALTTYARLFRVPAAVTRAERCAVALSRLQGSQGQWWWDYNVRHGRIADAYPVHSGSQDGSMPIALDSLHAAAGHVRYRSNIVRGVAWVTGDNERRESLVDESDGVVWRGMESRDGQLEIVRQVYAYHPARCLYWLATRDLLPGAAGDAMPAGAVTH